MGYLSGYLCTVQGGLLDGHQPPTHWSECTVQWVPVWQRLKGARATAERIQQFSTVVLLRLERGSDGEREKLTDMGVFTEF